jgi:hypothetical protein
VGKSTSSAMALGRNAQKSIRSPAIADTAVAAMKNSAARSCHGNFSIAIERFRRNATVASSAARCAPWRLPDVQRWG